jgi:hypothetical protein
VPNVTSSTQRLSPAAGHALDVLVRQSWAWRFLSRPLTID